MYELDNTSVAETYYYIRELMFVPNFGFNPYTDMEFSDPTKIYIERQRRIVRLKRQSLDGLFSTDADIYFRTEVVNPLAARQIELVQVKSREPRGTYTQIKLYNGTSDYYWDGVAWSIAGTSDWNSEGDVNANLATFPFLPARTLAVVVNLKTDDAYVTPEISEVLVLFRLRIDYLEDLIFRSMIPHMKQEIRPVANYPLPPLTTGVAQLTLSDYELDTPFEVTDVEAVYDFTADSELLYDIFDSYNATTTVITLTSTLPAGHVPFVLFRYVPRFVYTTQQDYIEIAKVPSIVLQRMEIPFAGDYSLLSRETIVDKGTGRAVIVKEPWRATLEFRIHVYADRAVDEVRLMSALMKYFESNQSVHFIGVDEHYRMMVIRELRDLNTPSHNDEHVFWTRFQIIDVKMPLVSEEGYGIRKISLIFSEPLRSDEDEWASGHTDIVLHSPWEPGEVPAWNETVTIEP